jgi:cell division protein ZapB
MEDKPLEQEAEARFKALEARIESLIRCCERLHEENRLLRRQQEALTVERAMLIDKNEKARSRVEAMITRLKSMEEAL